MLLTIISAIVAFGFGFLVGNRSAKGEGAAAVAAAKAAASTVKTDATKI
jgi:hypothetical protein